MKKKLALQLLGEFLKNSRRSDRQLAKALGVSQPTITRYRRELEQEGMIEAYTIVPNFEKLGFEIMALTFVKMRSEILSPKTMKHARQYASEFPHAVFASTGEGLGMTGVIISFHRDYTDYHHCLNLLRREWKEFTEDIQSFIISLKEGEFKRFSLTYLKDVPFLASS